MKLDFEIAVDQQTRTRDRTFEGIRTLGVCTGAHGTATPIFGKFWPNFPYHLNMIKTMLWGALLVATNLLNTCLKVLSKLDKNWLSYEKNII